MAPQDDQNGDQKGWQPRMHSGGGDGWRDQRISNLEGKAAEFETKAAVLRGNLREIEIREAEREERRKDQFQRIATVQQDQFQRLTDNQREENTRLRAELAAMRQDMISMRQDMHKDMDNINKTIDGVKKAMPNTTYVDLIWNTGKHAVILILGIVVVMVLNSAGISK